ncbi:MAG TPA: 1,4-alpha-glucan branching protein domain-containing protein [Oculatellaceae cyanobacterium]
MSVGSFVFMLHSHLPYYRKAGMWPFGEESVYECMAETYIPLLNAIADLWDEGIPAKLTIGITPILCEQLSDPHLNAGFDKFLGDRIHAAQQDEKRFSPRGEAANVDFLHLAKFYTNWFEKIRRDYHERWNRDIIAGFRKYQDLGAIEITTSAATHCFSPLLKTDSSLFGQYKAGVESYKRHFGRAPKGFWLPECAYRPAEGDRAGIEKWLYELGLQYFFTESFVIEGGQTVELRRVFGPYGSVEYIPVPPRPATGLNTFEAYWLKEYPVAVLGRHEKAGYQVWSADHGYPGDGNYREFHKKDDVSGLHFWKLTSKTTDLGEKQLYSPEAAAHRVRENSDHYVGFLQEQLTDHLKKTGKPGLVMVSFDTELFGHWWFEGVSWIKDVIKKLRTYTAVTMRTASEFLEFQPPTQAIEIPQSSWGSGGHWQVWLNNETEWMWPLIHDAEVAMEDIAEANNNKSDALTQRALKQAARELVLLQSSDWPFLVTTGQAKQYAVERFNQHVERFKNLVEMLRFNKLDEAKIAEYEDVDNPFPTISASDFARPQQLDATAARS